MAEGEPRTTPPYGPPFPFSRPFSDSARPRWGPTPQQSPSSPRKGFYFERRALIINTETKQIEAIRFVEASERLSFGLLSLCGLFAKVTGRPRS